MRRSNVARRALVQCRARLLQCQPMSMVVLFYIHACVYLVPIAVELEVYPSKIVSTYLVHCHLDVVSVRKWCSVRPDVASCVLGVLGTWYHGIRGCAISAVWLVIMNTAWVPNVGISSRRTSASLPPWYLRSSDTESMSMSITSHASACLPKTRCCLWSLRYPYANPGVQAAGLMCTSSSSHQSTYLRTYVPRYALANMHPRAQSCAELQSANRHF